MTTPTAQQFLTALRSYLGVTEYPYGSNRTRVGREFGWNGVAWCAETQSVAARRAGFGQRFWSASTDVWEANARRGVEGARWISKYAKPRPGDVCVWDWRRDGTANHVSAVETVLADGRLVTIGGNESNRCQRAIRGKRGLRGYVRMPFRILSVVKPPVRPIVKPPPEDDDMATAVKGNDSPKVYATNWIHKNHIPEDDDLQQMIASGLKTNGGKPFVVAQTTIDAIPSV